jgi:ectoine hydroxylase-related dioxygenase (phytanoyl-CoA dioxygenase family)
MNIFVSSEERARARLTDEHCRQAVQAIREDGYVVLDNVIEHAHLDSLLEKMLNDLKTLFTARRLPVNFVRGHVQQDPPPFAPYVFRDVVANPLIVQVTQGVLGKGLFNSFYSGNTNCPGSGTQPVHVDTGQLWPGLTTAHPAASLVVNVAPMEVTERNGSIELWPGTHLDTTRSVADATIKLDEATLETRRRVVPPIRGNTAKGSALVRDIRLWHRGMPNESDTPRPMIAMIHNIHWMHRGKPLRFNKGCEDAFAESDLDPNALFTDEPMDYIFRNHPYDYDE